MWNVGGVDLESRLFLGSAMYDSPDMLLQSLIASRTEVVTVSLRRQGPDLNAGKRFFDLLREQNKRILPNTAGCHTAREAITTANMAREVFATNWIKLEVIGDDYNLQPDPFELLAAAKALLAEGFEVFPYCTADLVVAQRLVEAGCKILMPWAAPIGSGMGPTDIYALKILRARLPNTILIVDAGLGKPSHAAEVMELGYDGVLLNSAVALAENPPLMAEAFECAVKAGRLGFEAKPMLTRNSASASTPTIGTPFWQQAENQIRN
jgi:thiazole synthase